MQAANKLQELRQAVHDLQERGLLQGAKWAAEHAVALQQVCRACVQRQCAVPDRTARHSWPAMQRRRLCVGRLSRSTTCTHSPRRSSI